MVVVEARLSANLDDRQGLIAEDADGQFPPRYELFDHAIAEFFCRSSRRLDGLAHVRYDTDAHAAALPYRFYHAFPRKSAAGGLFRQIGFAVEPDRGRREHAGLDKCLLRSHLVERQIAGDRSAAGIDQAFIFEYLLHRAVFAEFAVPGGEEYIDRAVF